MENRSIDKYIAGFGISFFITSLLNALLVVIKETNEPVMIYMKAATGHHWITHGVVVIVLFIIIGLAISNMNAVEKWKLDEKKISNAVVGGAVTGAIIIAGFYLANA
jgi:hypothetical protein